MITNEMLLNQVVTLLPRIDGVFMRPFLETARGSVSPLQLRILLIVRQRGSLCMRHTAQQLHVKKQQLSAAIERLKDLGYLRCRVDPQDRRRVEIGLTPRGKTFLSQLFDRLHAGHQERFDCLNRQEKEQLSLCLQEMVYLLDKIGEQS